jgi:hypothetical protein
VCVQDGHDPGLVGVSWRKVTTILKVSPLCVCRMAMTRAWLGCPGAR